MRQSTELEVVRHVSGSGDLSRWFDFVSAGVPAGGSRWKPARVLLSLRLASAPKLAFDVPVCTNKHPLLGAWILVRVEEDTWRLTPSVWRGETELADVAALHPRLPVGSLLLVGTPPDVTEQILQIGAPPRA